METDQSKAPPDKSFPADPRSRLFFAIALAMLAGTADSIGFLEFSQLFMSFMSGNTTRFGVAVANGDWENVSRVASTMPIPSSWPGGCRTRPCRTRAGAPWRSPT